MTPAVRELGGVLEGAREAGAKASEVLVTTEQGLELTLAAGTTHPTRRRWNTTVAVVRCWLDGGGAGEARGPLERAEALVAEAMAAAAKAPEDPHGGPVRRMDPPPRGLGVDDPRHEQITDAERTEVLTMALRGALAAKAPVVAGPFVYREARGHRRFLNSHGVGMEIAHTRYDALGALTLRAPEGPIELTDHIAGRAFASTACLPYGAQLAQRAQALAGEATSVEGPVRVLFPPRPTGRLVAWLARMFSVHALAEGRNLVTRGADEPLFHRKLHLVDDGLAPGGLHTRGFDDRGVTPVPLTLLREGVVAGRLLDPEAARALDTRPTGHCWPEGLLPTNLQLNSGARSMSAWLGEQDRPVFEVDDLPELDGAIDPETGEATLRVHGQLRERHDVLGVGRFVTLRGNLVDVLRQVHGIASDTDRILHVDAPGLFLDGFVATPHGA